ncbi:MAG: Asp-tRNA(Asn)/Glu-tRNA(Gln) amidotransferase subunit GatB [Myxococcales bacterium]|nr:Asp-tRNA(Asn)/Glu-tRNA(Gln) amidotransferase subunit GatB [Myxococcales bacterium]USN49817.1 MAG: Asp-tRNA(Asn)/Glu-tRNA(Gln) amidotransferase subunit GatB [Myxococcales bacterium]
MNFPFEAYEIVIGFECHVQLNTKSKLFSKGANVFGASPNSLLDIVDAGLPGVLPVINKSAVNDAVKLGAALSCCIRKESVFSRKHYFYPDLPKGYQISQFDKPICENGVLHFMVDGQPKSVRIQRIHIEEDAGKNTHAEGMNASFVDYNRAGTPLLEVVSEPDLRSAKDAMEAFKALRQMVTFLNICDGNMQEGSLRADINVSVRKKGEIKLGTRTETKNLNSFKFLGQAIAFEARRQIIEIESGRKINQETRLWDPALKESRSMRSKEEAHDYRYFPDPDLPPLFVDENTVQNIAKNIPELPLTKLQRYQKDYGLSFYDAEILTSEKALSDFFESAISLHNNPKSIANWIINEVLRSTKETQDVEGEVSEFKTSISPRSIGELVKMVDDKIISNTIAKKVFSILAQDTSKSPPQIVEENNWQVVLDDREIESFVLRVLKENPVEVDKFRAGKTKILGFLMGQTMKLAKGKIAPDKAQQLMLQHLNKK